MSKYRALTPEQYLASEALLEPLVRTALSKGASSEYIPTYEAVQESVSQLRMLPIVWGDMEGVMLLELDGDNLVLTVISGYFGPDWVPEAVAMWHSLAKEQDKKGIIGGGRKGWLRKLKPFGFRAYGDFYITEVTQ